MYFKVTGYWCDGRGLSFFVQSASGEEASSTYSDLEILSDQEIMKVYNKK